MGQFLGAGQMDNLDGAVVAVVRKRTRLSGGEVPAGVLSLGLMGWPGADCSGAAHLDETDNPHCDVVTGIVAPGQSAGKWFCVDPGGVLAVTLAVPLYPADLHWPAPVDNRVRADAGGDEVTLAGAVDALFVADTGTHRLRLKGDETPGRRRWWGVDAAGTVGFWAIPGKAVIP